MELFSLVLINILFGGILYVFVSAKVQKSVSEYYDKKLDRAIDMATSETIRELDATVGVIESRLVALRSMIEKAELIAKEFKHYESVKGERPANKQTIDEVSPLREIGMSLEKELSQSVATAAQTEPNIHSLKEQRSGVGQVYQSNQFIANESEVVTIDGAVNQVFGKLGKAVKGILGMEGISTPTNDAVGSVELPQFKPKMDFTVGGNPFSEKKEESDIIRDENKEGKTRKEFLTEMAYANDPAYASHQKNFEDQIALSLESALEELPASAGKIDKVVHLLKKGYSHEDISDVMNIGTHEIHLIETIRLDRSRRI
ncbi:hypothetical protein [Leptospira sp. 'Mane']|uniref:hypothetical protein n=1 Tax=Leptospira sp. 'Mane' TaxID=3387407 RepID=UPI00398B47AA